jgi:hypothetical protein
MQRVNPHLRVHPGALGGVHPPTPLSGLGKQLHTQGAQRTRTQRGSRGMPGTLECQPRERCNIGAAQPESQDRHKGDGNTEVQLLHVAEMTTMRRGQNNKTQCATQPAQWAGRTSCGLATCVARCVHTRGVCTCRTIMLVAWSAPQHCRHRSRHLGSNQAACMVHRHKERVWTSMHCVAYSTDTGHSILPSRKHPCACRAVKGF